MKYKDYLDSCMKFAEETDAWGGLEPGNLYTTSSLGDWKESCDNDHGGLDVAWAFQLSPDNVLKHAPQEFVDQLLDGVDQARDEGFDDQQWDALLRIFR